MVGNWMRRGIRAGVLGLCLTLGTLPGVGPGAGAQGQDRGQDLASAPPRRVVSLNLCTDQLLLDLADPAQILALSRNAHDPRQSWAAARARGYPTIGGTAEEVLHLRPDLVVTGPYVAPLTEELLKRYAISLVRFEIVTTLAEIRAQLAVMGDRLGQPARAAVRIAALDARIAAAQTIPPPAARRVLPLERRGWVEGEATLTGELLRAVGLVHAAAGSARAGGGLLGLERALALRPDWLLIGRDDPQAEDQGVALLAHPAVRRLIPPNRVLVLPGVLSVCGGPATIEALTHLQTLLTLP